MNFWWYFWLWVGLKRKAIPRYICCCSSTPFMCIHSAVTAACRVFGRRSSRDDHPDVSYVKGCCCVTTSLSRGQWGAWLTCPSAVVWQLPLSSPFVQFRWSFYRHRPTTTTVHVTAGRRTANSRWHLGLFFALGMRAPFSPNAHVKIIWSIARLLCNRWDYCLQIWHNLSRVSSRGNLGHRPQMLDTPLNFWNLILWCMCVMDSPAMRASSCWPGNGLTRPTGGSKLAQDRQRDRHRGNGTVQTLCLCCRLCCV